MEGEEKRVDETEEEKREREKVVLGKVLFVFVDCVFASSLFSCTHHTTTSQHTLSHTHHTPYNMTHWCTPSHANRAMCCAAFFGSGQRDTLHHPHPTLHHLTSHTNQPNADPAHGACNNEMIMLSEKGIGQRAKVGQHSSTNTLIEVATTQWL